MDHRFDIRTKEAFKKHIKSNHINEAVIAVRLCIAVHSKTKKWPALIPTGIDSSGEFIENIKDVTSEPDFKIDDRLVEITRADVICERSFHQKCHKVQRALDNKSELVFVNGFKASKQPQYIWLNANELEPFVIRAKTKYGQVWHPAAGGTQFIKKPAYKFDVYWFKDLWRPLPVLIKDIPKEYKDIMNSTKV